MKIQTQNSLCCRNIFVIAIIALTLLRSGKCSTEPCTDPSVIGDTRRTTTEDPGTCGALCDNNIREDVWYRLDASNSGARMPESSVAVWHCGTHIPIWLNGAHPTADNPGPVTLPVCAQLRPNGPECDWTNQISVKRCSANGVEFFVYMLKKTPFCDMAYCAGNGINCASNGSWNDVKQQCINPPYPTLDTVPVLTGPYIPASGTKTVTDDKGNPFQATTFNMKCTLTYTKQTTDDGARYDVVFLSNDRTVYTTTLTSTQDSSVEMSETYLQGSVGQTVTCKVASYWKSQYPTRSPYRTSNSFKFDIYFVDASNAQTSALAITESTPVKLNVKTSFIITTPWCFNLPVGSTCYPYYTFLVSSSSLLVSVCTFRINATTQTSGDIWVSSVPDIAANGKSGYIYFQTNSDLQAQNSIFSSYKSNTIPVSISDPTPWNTGTSSGDPHIQPFGTILGSYYYHVYLEGTFLLLRVASKDIEIHVQLFPCNGVTCNCGVIAREGNNVLSINSCGSSTLTERFLSDEANPGGTIRYQGGTTWIMTLPSGLVITADVYGQVMNLNVQGNGIDSYFGFLANPNLPSQCSGCQCSTECNVAFSVGSGSLFSYSRSNPPPCLDPKPPIVPQCDCLNGASPNRICTVPDNTGLVPSTLSNSICKSSSPRRKRESSSANQNHKIEKRQSSPNTQWPTTSGITQTDATNACNSALTVSPVYPLCVTNLQVNVSTIIYLCVLDIQIMDDKVTPPKYVANLLQNVCKYTIDKTSNGNDSSVQQYYEDIVCPNQCSKNGNCAKGQCTCNPGYMSDDCSVKQGQIPLIQYIVYATCDVRNGCPSVYLQATGASSDLVCQFTNGTTVISYDKSPYISGGLIECKVPAVPDTTVNFANYTFYVSVSNGASMKYSNEIKFVIYNGSCVSCDGSSGCTNKQTACNILGRCYDSGTVIYCGQNRTDSRVCNPLLSNTKWLPPNAKDGNQGSVTCSSSRPVAASMFLLLSYIVMKLIKENKV